MITFDPHQYAIDKGWDFSQVQATAERGVAPEDAEGLSEFEQDQLLAWCIERVESEVQP